MKRKGMDQREADYQKVHYRAESEQFFDDSAQPPPKEKIQEYEEIGQICQKEREELMSRKQGMKKNAKKQEKYMMEEKSSSQFLPNSGQSFQNEESGSLHSSKLEGDSQLHFASIFKKYSKELADPRQKQQTINQIAEITKKSVQEIKKKVQKYLKRQKGSVQKPAQAQVDHQTIYRKTEMFDDAIKRVLKVTPYACINDLKEEINLKLGLDLAKQTLIRRLKNLNYSYTKFGIQKKERNDDQKINQMRQQYYYFYQHMLEKRFTIYFYGYCHIAIDQCKGSMWIKTKENQQLDHIIHEKDVINVSIILHESKIVSSQIEKGFYCRNSYRTALEVWTKKYELQRRHKIQPKKSQCSFENRSYLIAEASQIHNEESLLEESELSEMLRSHNIELIAFPPYSYSLNPAEELFNQIKFVVKSKAKGFEINEFINTVKQVIDSNIDFEDIKFAYGKANKSLEKWHEVKRE